MFINRTYAMDIEMFREYCLSLPGTTEDLKWGDNLCFLVHEKIFVISSLDRGSTAFKCDREDFNALVERDGIAQAFHLAKGQWVQIDAFDVMPVSELKDRIAASRALVIGKLPKKIQALYADDLQD
jgi:predicted DNA-binding protein (MmcQ/YjbR family)